MEAYKLKEGIYWVGAIDWHLRSFHGYKTARGSTYNAYLIIDDKITLIDTVKAKFTEEMIERIKTVIDPSKIDIIISNHGESDHSGSIEAIMKLSSNAKLYCSINGVKSLKEIYGNTLSPIPVKNGEELSIGKRTLKFFYATMVHWPDSMATYDEYDKILFSNDAFGQHLATSKRLDCDYDLAVIMQEARKYYANIVLPYSNPANKVANALKTLNIKMIATGHGIIWKDHIKEIFDLYDEMTTHQKKDKAVIVYDSMWGATAKIGSVITDSLMKAGISAILFDINNTDISDIIIDVMDAKYLAVGSSTINSNMLPPIAAFLCYLKGLAPQGLKTIAFGSYGWGGQSIDLIEAEFEKMKYEKLIPSIKIQYSVKVDQIMKIEEDIKNAFLK